MADTTKKKRIHGGHKAFCTSVIKEVPVLGAFVLTLNCEPAAFFCKSNPDLAD